MAHQDATPNPRIAKLAEQIRTIVAEMLGRRIKDPRLGFVTITDVRLTGDAREATIFYTVMGSETDRLATAAALRSANGVLRSAVGKKLGLRHAPSLTFVLDATPESAAAIEDLLAAAKLRDEELAAASAQAHFAGEADPYRRPGEHEDDDDEADDVEDDDATER